MVDEDRDSMVSGLVMFKGRSVDCAAYEPVCKVGCVGAGLLFGCVGALGSAAYEPGLSTEVSCVRARSVILLRISTGVSCV